MCLHEILRFCHLFRWTCAPLLKNIWWFNYKLFRNTYVQFAFIHFRFSFKIVVVDFHYVSPSTFGERLLFCGKPSYSIVVRDWKIFGKFFVQWRPRPFHSCRSYADWSMDWQGPWMLLYTTILYSVGFTFLSEISALLTVDEFKSWWFRHPRLDEWNIGMCKSTF